MTDILNVENMLNSNNYPQTKSNKKFSNHNEIMPFDSIVKYVTHDGYESE